jgi:DNA-directed RNA polymerase subunit omega
MNCRKLFMTSDLVNLALEKVGSANVLVNLVSRRVRQLNAGGRALIADRGLLGLADTALLEIIEGKMGWARGEWEEVTSPVTRNVWR